MLSYRHGFDILAECIFIVLLLFLVFFCFVFFKHLTALIFKYIIIKMNCKNEHMLEHFIL